MLKMRYRARAGMIVQLCSCFHENRCLVSLYLVVVFACVAFCFVCIGLFDVANVGPQFHEEERCNKRRRT